MNKALQDSLTMCQNEQDRDVRQDRTIETIIHGYLQSRSSNRASPLRVRQEVRVIDRDLSGLIQEIKPRRIQNRRLRELRSRAFKSIAESAEAIPDQLPIERERAALEAAERARAQRRGNQEESQTVGQPNLLDNNHFRTLVTLIDFIGANQDNVETIFPIVAHVQRACQDLVRSYQETQS